MLNLVQNVLISTYCMTVLWLYCLLPSVRATFFVEYLYVMGYVLRIGALGTGRVSCGYVSARVVPRLQSRLGLRWLIQDGLDQARLDCV